MKSKMSILLLIAGAIYGEASAQYAGEWNPIGKAVYTEDLISLHIDGIAGISWNVEAEEYSGRPGLYRIVNPYGGGSCPFMDREPAACDIVINAEDATFVYIEPQDLGFGFGNGNYTVATEAGCVVAESGVDAARVEGMAGGRLVDGVISFPAGALLIGEARVASGKMKPTNLSGKFKVQLPRMSGIDGVAVDIPAPVYYDLQGMEVDCPQPGRLYIRVSDGQAEKVIMRQ